MPFHPDPAAPPPGGGTDLSLLEFREQLFGEELDALTRLLNGEGASLLPFVRDERGAYSEARVWATVRELTDCAQLCRQHAAPPVAGRAPFQPPEREFLENFFYCALRVSTEEALLDIAGQDASGATGTFRDLIRYAAERYDDAVALYVAEAGAEALRNNYADMKGLYRPASLLYHLFTGRDLCEEYPPSVREAWAAYLPAELKEQLAFWQCPPARLHETRWAGTEVIGGEECFPWKAAWLRENFPQPARFARRYLAFRNTLYWPGYLPPDGEDLALLDRMEELGRSLDWLVKRAVRLFAHRKGLCRLMDDDTYFTAAALVRRAVRRLRGGAENG